MHGDYVGIDLLMWVEGWFGYGVNKKVSEIDIDEFKEGYKKQSDHQNNLGIHNNTRQLKVSPELFDVI